MPAVTDLILVNLGTPTEPTPAGVRAFLREFLSDPMVVEKPRWLWLPILHGIVLRTRPRKVAEAYREIWTPAGSPLRAGTTSIAGAVQARLGPPETSGVRVTHAFRYGSPSIAERLDELADGGGPVRVLPLFPQRTASSSGTVVDLVARLARERGMGGRLEAIEMSPTSPPYVASLATGVRKAWDELGFGAPQDPTKPPHLVVSFHGIPEYVNEKEGQTYTADCAATFEALLAALGQPRERATLAYQSRFGFDPWVGPATDEVLVELPARGVDRVVVATPGFLTAGLETIEEIGIRAREDFEAAGGKAFALAPTPVVAVDGGVPLPDDDFVEAVAELVRGD